MNPLFTSVLFICYIFLCVFYVIKKKQKQKKHAFSQLFVTCEIAQKKKTKTKLNVNPMIEKDINN